MAVAVSRGIGLGRPSWKANADIILTVLVARLKIISRYKGLLVMEAFLPIVFAAFPLMLGIAIGGENAGANFMTNTGATADYKMFMLLGACTFTVVTLMMWLIGYWVRREQETGTLESLYLAPAKRFYVLAGVTTYAFLRSMLVFFIALLLGSLLFQVNPFGGNIGLAMLFVAAGFFPLWGIGFIFGAFILKIKEANSVIQMVQWIVAFLMGIYYPITFFPSYLQYVAASFPPTIMNDGIRSSMLGIGYIFGSDWWVSFALLLALSLFLPLLGYQIFMATERRLKRKEGVGQY